MLLQLQLKQLFSMLASPIPLTLLIIPVALVVAVLRWWRRRRCALLHHVGQKAAWLAAVEVDQNALADLPAIALTLAKLLTRPRIDRADGFGFR